MELKAGDGIIIKPNGGYPAERAKITRVRKKYYEIVFRNGNRCRADEEGYVIKLKNPMGKTWVRVT